MLDPISCRSKLQEVRVHHVSRRKALVVAALVFAAVVLGPLFAGTLLMWPHQHPVRLPAGFEGTEVSFASESGAVLRGNLLKGTPGRGVVILMHGVRGHRGEMAGHAEFLHKAGYSVLLFDFQAHGESSGSRITSGYLESMDARAAVDFVRREFPGEKVGVLGVSLGGWRWCWRNLC
jgi:predicted alpha/beta-fold hydrolase